MTADRRTPPAQPQPLALDRSLTPAGFVSWRLGGRFVAAAAARHSDDDVDGGDDGAPAPAARLPLPQGGGVWLGADEAAVDFWHTRAAATRNHLAHSSCGRVLLLLAAAAAGDEGGGDAGAAAAAAASNGAQEHEQQRRLRVVEMCWRRQPLSLAVVADVPLPPASAPRLAEEEPALHGSLAVVAGAPGWLLVSSGRGDLRLVCEGAGAAAASQVSAAVFPLHAPAGVRPFTVEAAWRRTAASEVRVAVSAAARVAGDNGGRGLASGWVAETWLLTLRLDGAPGPAASPLRVEAAGAQLLLVARAPPAAAVASAAADALLLVSEPALDADDLPAGFYAARPPCAAAPPAARRGDAGGVGGGGGAARQGSSSNGGGGKDGDDAAAAAADDDDDDDDVDPRTLAAAAARLAAYASEERERGPAPPQQWTDVFRESGPDEFGGGFGGGGGGADQVEAELLLFAARLSEARPHQSSSSSSGGGSGHQLALVSAVSAGPHRLLSAQPLVGDGGGGDGVWLGLADDVDCAVVSARIGTTTAATTAAAGNGAAPGSSAAQQPRAAPQLRVSHEASLPALAYVCVGKTQRRHLLLAGAGCAGGGSGAPVAISAVLCEARRYMYLYGRPGGRAAPHGPHELLDMQLEGGGAVEVSRGLLGARLLEGGGRGALLVLLTAREVLAYELLAADEGCGGGDAAGAR